jgi:hypothetical protein
MINGAHAILYSDDVAATRAALPAAGLEVTRTAAQPS